MGIAAFLFGASLALSISGSLIVGGVLTLAVILRSFTSQNWGGPLSKIEALILMLFVWTVFTTVLRRAAGLGNAISYQSAFLVAFLVARFFKKDEMNSCLWGFVLGAAFGGLMGLLQPCTGIWYDSSLDHYNLPPWAEKLPKGVLRYLSLHTDRSVGTRSHPLTFAETLMPAFYLAGWSLFQKPSLKNIFAHAWVRGAVFLFIAGGLVVSQSRGIWLGLVLGGGVLLFNLPSKLRGRFILGFVLVLGLFLASSPQYRSRFLSIFSFQAGRQTDRDSSQIRFQLWSQSLDRIREKPILGWGLKKATLFTMDPVYHIERTWTESHNIFLQTAMESGLPGLAFFLGILFLMGRSLYQLQGPDRLWLAACALTFLVAGLTESWTRDKEVALLFWGFVGWVDLKRKTQEVGNG